MNSNEPKPKLLQPMTTMRMPRVNGQDTKGVGAQQRIRCVLCPKGVYIEGEDALMDHIARYHLSYTRHRCETCGLKSVGAVKMWAHCQESGHRVTLNKVSGSVGRSWMDMVG